MGPRMARHRVREKRWLWVTPLVVLPLAALAFSWWLHLSDEGHHVAPNVRFAGQDVGGLTTNEASALVADRMEEVMSTPISIETADLSTELTVSDLGFTYDHGRTVDRLVGARHGDGIWSEIRGWVNTPFNTEVVEEVIELDEDVLSARFDDEEFVFSLPTEPSLTNEGKSFIYVVPGEPGSALDVERAMELVRAMHPQDGSVVLEPGQVELPPAVSDDEAEQMALELNDSTRAGASVIVGTELRKLTPGQIRSNLLTEIVDGRLEVAVDVEGLQAEIETIFADHVGPFTPPVMDVVDGQPEVVTAGSVPAVCCSTESVADMAERILSGESRTFRLEMRPSEDPVLASWADGSVITAEVSTFTTFHSCCENRVVNIQTIADALTGYYLVPGETLSLNEYVGPRTREKGYLPAGAIRSGHLTDEVGGGISQFITTLFNAAYFGGLDLDEYQSHSVYFSRYPFGREATMSIPGPDLVLTNSTDYPVLIWPTYTPSSITVTLYSTPNVEVEELGQRVSFFSQCRHVQTDRQRTFSDGRVVVDTIVANYRPGDGLDCNGNPIPEPQD